MFTFFLQAVAVCGLWSFSSSRVYVVNDFFFYFLSFYATRELLVVKSRQICKILLITAEFNVIHSERS